MSKKGLSFKDWALENKPREKMFRYGVEKLSVIELLAVVLGTGTRNLNVIDCASEVLKQTGGLIGLREQQLSQLMKIKGLDLAKAARLKASLELGKKLFQEQKSTKRIVSSAKDLVDFYVAQTKDLKQSLFYLILLSGRNEVIMEEEIYRGTLTDSLIHPREIFGRAIEERACGIILLHNHPSGSSQPTALDLKIAKKLKQAGELLGISVFDYVILGRDGYCSLREKGII